VKVNSARSFRSLRPAGFKGSHVTGKRQNLQAAPLADTASIVSITKIPKVTERTPSELGKAPGERLELST